MNLPQNRRPAAAMSRRRFLEAAGLLSGASLLGVSACGGDSDAPAADSGDAIEILDSGAKLPSGETTLRWLGTPDQMVGFRGPFFAAYQKAHPNIKIEYEGFDNKKIAEILPLGVRNKSAHDIFPKPSTIQTQALIQRGWVAPVEDIIPDFDKVKAAFPKNTFLEGENVFGGKTYTLPQSDSRRYNNIILYNKELLDRADVDPSSWPPTWSEFRDALKKVTKAGNGQFYGIALPKARLTNFVNQLSMSGAPHLDYTDPLTGEFIFTTDAFRETVEYVVALKNDGSLFPGSVSLAAQEATARVVRGNVAVMMDGPWTPPQWERDEPDFAFGVSAQPVPDSGKPVPMPVTADRIGWWVYAESKVKEVAADILWYLATPEGSTVVALREGYADSPVFPEAKEALRKSVSDNGKKVLDMSDSMVLPPNPVVRNPDVVKVLAESKAPTPRINDVLEGIMAGQIDDIPGALRQLQDAYSKSRDDGIAAARAKGAKVSRDDWVFPNYDPMVDYGQDKYDELG